MTILVSRFAPNYEPSLKSIIFAGVFSLVFGILFTFFLPRLIDKKMKDNRLLCIGISAVGSVYMLVEILTLSIALSVVWKNGPEAISGLIMLGGFIFFWIGNIYLYSYVYKKIKIVIQKTNQRIDELKEQYLEDKIFGGILSLYSGYAILIFGLTPMIWQSMSNFHNDNKALIIPLLFVSGILPWFVGMAVNRFIMLNGEMVAAVKNGETITVETAVAHNYIQMFDQNGLGAGYERVTLSPNEKIEVVLVNKTAK